MEKLAEIPEEEIRLACTRQRRAAWAGLHALGPGALLLEKALKELPAAFNARAEAVAEKPMFRGAFQKRHCIILASGFFEWTWLARAGVCGLVG